MARSRNAKPYSERSKSSQRRIDRTLNRLGQTNDRDRRRALRQLREGTWRPYSRGAHRVPKGIDSGTLAQMYAENMDKQFGHLPNYSADSVRHRAQNMVEDDLGWGATASKTELEQSAKQPIDENDPNRAFPGWYHPGS